VLAVSGRVALAWALLVAGCALAGRGEAPIAPTRANDFRAAEVRQTVVLVRVVIGAAAGLSERERKEAPALYESALLEALDARAILVRDVRSVEAGAAIPDARAAAARARDVGVDHALVVSVRVEPSVVRVCEETRRPLQGRATVWRQDGRVVRAADGGERVRAEITTPAVEAECEGARPSARPRGVAATTADAVERLLGKLFAR
jgi:hypothetical protein